MPKVSIIIRSKNDIEFIEQTMQAIQKQTLQDLEIINVDSTSNDGTYEIIKKYNKGIVYQIEPSSYIPGKILNEAIEQAKGEIIVFNNSDCIPMHSTWLENLIKPLTDKKIAATFGNQITRENAFPLVKKDYERAFGSGQGFRNWFHFFSLATSAVRKKLITEYPFDPGIQYSEDIEWSYRMKKQGFLIHYVANSIVEHSHNYTLPEVYKRFHGEGKAEGKIYNHHLNPIQHLLIPIVLETLRDVLYLINHNEWLWIPYSPVYRIIQKYGVYKGNLDFFKNQK